MRLWLRLLAVLLVVPAWAHAQIPAGTVQIGQGGNLATVNAFGQLSVIGSTLVPALSPGSAFALQPGAMVLGVVQNAPVYSLGGVQPLSLTPFGALRVDGSGVLQPVTLPTFGVFNTTQPTWPSGLGVIPQATSRGALIVGTGADTFNVTCSNCSGSGVSQTDSATWTVASSLFVSGGGVFQTTATNNALTNLQMGTFQVTAQRALFTNLRNASGVELGIAATPLRIDPTGTTAQPVSESGTWTVQPGNTANTTPWLVTINQGGNSAAVDASNRLSVICSSGCSGGPADESAFTFGTTAIVSGGVFQTTPTNNALTNLQAGNFQVTAHRALFTNLRTASGQELGTPASPLAVSTGPVTVQGLVSGTPPIYVPGSSQTVSLTPTGGLRVDGTYGLFPNQQSNVVGNFNTTAGSTQNLTLWGLALPGASGAVIGGTSTNPVRFDPTGTTTQPVSCSNCSGTVTVGGTVTANQGTANATPWNENIAQINGVTPLMGNGVTGTGSQRVTIASDNTAFAVNATLSAETTKVIGTVNQGTSPWIVAGGGTAGTAATGVVTVQGIASMTKLLVTPDSVALPANQSVNVAQINAVTPLMGNGVTGTGSPRVTIASDNTAFAVSATLQTGANTIGALTANQSVNLAQVAGVATSTGVGAAGTGTARVVDVASGTTGSAVPAQASYLAGNGGGNLTGATVCDTQQRISVTANTQLITGTAAKHVYLCHIDVVVGAATNVAIVSGTGTVCATGIAGVFGGSTAATGWNFAANGGIATGGGIGWVGRTVATGDNICILVSAANQTSGNIVYTVY